MVKPKPPCTISKTYTTPEEKKDELEFEPYILPDPIWNFCDPSEHVNTIPINILAKIDPKHLYNDLIQGLYAVSNRKINNNNSIDLKRDAKEYIKQAHAYCAKKPFETKLVKKINSVLEENEEYLNDIKIKEAKKRTAQEAELLGVDMAHKSIKQYRSETLADVSNTIQKDKDKGKSRCTNDSSTSRSSNDQSTFHSTIDPSTSHSTSSPSTSCSTIDLSTSQSTNDPSTSHSTIDPSTSHSTSSSSTSRNTIDPSTSHSTNEPYAPNKKPVHSSTIEKNQKRFIVNSAFSCLLAPHMPKIQKVDRKCIEDVCRLGIECLENDDRYKNSDAMKECRENRVKQNGNKSLSEFNGIFGFLGDVLGKEFDKLPCDIWKHPIHESTNTKDKQLANIISYTLTDFHCNCKQPMILDCNRERTPFVEYVVPMFKYLSKESNMLAFSCCEKLIEAQKYAQIAAFNYESTNTLKKYADGHSKANNCEALFTESSSESLQENINHTLEDKLKLIVECNGALCYILSRYRNSRFQTALKISTFGVQVTKNTLTLSKMNLTEDMLWKFVELRSTEIPTSWKDRFS